MPVPPEHSHSRRARPGYAYAYGCGARWESFCIIAAVILWVVLHHIMGRCILIV